MTEKKKFIKIPAEFYIEDVVYLKSDPDRLPRIVSSIVVHKDCVEYRLACGTELTDHWDYEITKELTVE
jgi:hypothetical protein